MSTDQKKNENNQTIIDLITCFNPTGNELEQHTEILKVMNIDFMRRYLKMNAINKDDIINMIIKVRYYAFVLGKRESLFYDLSSIATRLFSAKQVDIKEVFHTCMFKTKRL